MSSVKRQHVIDAAMDAYTLEECLSAEKRLQEWLQEYPDDFGMYDLVSMLATVRQAAVEEAENAKHQSDILTASKA